MRDPLIVRLHGTEIGELSPDGNFEWVSGWDRMAPLNSTALSHSLPWGADGFEPAPFFGGLLPEGLGLERLAREARVASNDLYGLLAEVGADVGGSVTVGEPRPPVAPIELPVEELGAMLDRAAGYIRGVAVSGGGSAATGVQAKLALTRNPSTGGWMIGRGSTPSTHILKPVPSAQSAVIRAEAYMNDLARALELSAHSAVVESAGDRTVLIVERYDRQRTSSGRIERLHQEDSAQALALPWGGNDKYESVNARASLARIAELLRHRRSIFASAPDPDAQNVYSDDRERLLALTVLNVVAGNTDAHAKNFSIMLPQLADTTLTSARLAEAYDVVPQRFLSPDSEPLAMRIAGESLPGAITVEKLAAEATAWGLSHTQAEAVIIRTLDSLAGSLRQGPAHGVTEKLLLFLQEQIDNLARGDSAWTRPLPPAIVFAGR